MAVDTTEEKIDAALAIAVGKINQGMQQPEPALKWSQAALNLAHVKSVLRATPKPKSS